MNRITLALVVILLLIGALFVGDTRGHARGLAEGKLAVQAKHDSDLVEQLSTTIKASTDLTTNANTASQTLRQSVSNFQSQYQPVIKEFSDALSETAPSRTGCVFSPGVMRQLSAAQHRAATAASKGLPGSSAAAVPGAAAPAGRAR